MTPKSPSPSPPSNPATLVPWETTFKDGRTDWGEFKGTKKQLKASATRLSGPLMRWTKRLPNQNPTHESVVRAVQWMKECERVMICIHNQRATTINIYLTMMQSPHQCNGFLFYNRIVKLIRVHFNFKILTGWLTPCSSACNSFPLPPHHWHPPAAQMDGPREVMPGHVVK